MNFINRTLKKIFNIRTHSTIDFYDGKELDETFIPCIPHKCKPAKLKFHINRPFGNLYNIAMKMNYCYLCRKTIKGVK